MSNLNESQHINGGLASTSSRPTSSVSVNHCGFKINPTLRQTLACVGAKDQVYNFIQIHSLVIKYLLQNRHLFDPVNKLHVNCENDPLANALGVDQFHCSNLKHILARNVILVVPYDESLRNNCSSSSPIKIPNLDPVSNNVLNTNGHHNHPTIEIPDSHPPTHSNLSENINISQTQPKSLPYSTTLNCLPNNLSGTESDETTHSYQGYATDLIRNTDLDSDNSQVSVIDLVDPSDSSEDDFDADQEEYEPVTDVDQNKAQSGSDSSSDFEDISIAVIKALEDQTNEDSFADIDEADDSEMETNLLIITKHSVESSSEDDPDIENDKWPCLLCGKRNKPYLRYCRKCWQARKNWLPDRPKKRRKPRPKKRKEMNTTNVPLRIVKNEENQNNEILTEDLDKKNKDLNDKIKIEDSETNINEEKDVPNFNDFNSQELQSSSLTCSQDSGIGLSQEIPSSLDNFDLSLPSTSKVEWTGAPTKRQRTGDIDEVKSKKKSKLSESPDKSSNLFDLDDMRQKKEWFKSKNGKIFLKELLDEKILNILSSDEDESVKSTCQFCYSRPKNASIIHGKISHQVSCYPCARRLFNSKFRCPICSRKIDKITKHYVI